MMKILLLVLVYLVHCEGAILFGWGRDKGRNVASSNGNNVEELFITADMTSDIKDKTATIKANAVMNGDSKRQANSNSLQNNARVLVNTTDCKATIDVNETQLTSHTEVLLSETTPKHVDNSRVQSSLCNSSLSGISKVNAIKNPCKQNTIDGILGIRSVSKQTDVEEHLLKKRNVYNVKIEETLNDRPIIGILAQEQSPYLQSKFIEQNYTSYIAASYVKIVESSGARVVPIMIGKNRRYYENLMRKINGVLLPGGATYFNQSHGFADAGQHIYEIAQQLNNDGHYFPVFGICLGFELLIILASGRGEKENRVSCHSYYCRSLNFTPDFRNSKMFEAATEDLIDILENENVTANAHQFCITRENIDSHNLTLDWQVTSYSTDDNGLKFVSSVEHRQYPFYGIQFHPEKSAFEWKISKHYSHTEDAIRVNRYFIEFFIKECKKNRHKFHDAAEENNYLIYNYAPKFTGILGSAYHQCYFFEPRPEK